MQGVCRGIESRLSRWYCLKGVTVGDVPVPEQAEWAGPISLLKTEGWQSGLTRRTRNAVGEQSPQRFESSTLRQIVLSEKS